MQREDGMTDTWVGMNLGHWPGLGFAAMGSLDLRLVQAENMQDLAESLNWIEPYDMKVHPAAAGCSPLFYTFHGCVYLHLKLPRQM